MDENYIKELHTAIRSPGDDGADQTQKQSKNLSHINQKSERRKPNDGE